MAKYQSFDDEEELQEGLHRFRLKKKDEQIQFRILGTGFVKLDQHIFQEGKRWNFIDCPKAQAKTKEDEYDIHCEWCDKYWELMRPYLEMKKLKDAGREDEVNPTAMQEAYQKAQKYRRNSIYHYLVLSRGEQLVGDLQISNSVHKQIQEMRQKARDKGQTDAAKWFSSTEFVLTRTEKLPQYYSLYRVDSAEIEPLTETEKHFVEEAQVKYGEDYAKFADEFSEHLTGEEQYAAITGQQAKLEDQMYDDSDNPF